VRCDNRKTTSNARPSFTSVNVVAPFRYLAASHQIQQQVQRQVVLKGILQVGDERRPGHLHQHIALIDHQPLSLLFKDASFVEGLAGIHRFCVGLDDGKNLPNACNQQHTDGDGRSRSCAQITATTTGTGTGNTCQHKTKERVT
jgi:hypothetical protein